MIRGETLLLIAKSVLGEKLIIRVSDLEVWPCSDGTFDLLIDSMCGNKYCLKYRVDDAAPYIEKILNGLEVDLFFRECNE
jgi:hypothetical protein